MKALSHLFAAAAMIVAVAALAGCGRQSVTNPDVSLNGQDGAAQALAISRGADSDANRAGFAGPGLTRIQFVHASPDAPAVDILLDQRRAASGLEFPGNTMYVISTAGERRVRVNVAGTSTSVIDATVPFARGANYSVFAVNAVASIEALLLADDLSTPAPGKAHVRFIHLSPNAPAVDVALEGGPVVFGNRSFKDFTPFTPLDAGTYDLEVRLAGTGTVVLPLPGITVEAGKIYTVFAKGFVGGADAQALGAQIIVNRDAGRGPLPGGPALGFND
jgi:hypothetical protein